MKNDKKLWVLGHHISPQKISADYDMVIGETPANVPGPPPHFHTKYNELFLVLEGEMEFVTDGKVKRVKKNESIDLPPNVLHTFKNAGSSTCKWANIHSPKGFLSFFEDMGVSASEPEAMNKSADEAIIQKVIHKAANYDMHIKI